jgi:regulation of enolase protein 1 (concanavalin A-like superfamily)
MDRTCLLLVIPLAASLFPPPASVKPVKAQTIEGWGTVVDPDGDCRVKQEKGKVTITVPETYHDLTYQGDRHKLNAPRILQDVGDDFRLQVKVGAFTLPERATSSSGGNVFLSCGLLAWADERNFVRLERASWSADSPVVFVELFRDGKSVWHRGHPIADRATYLRLSRRGNALTFEASEDGKDWTELHAQDFALPRKLQVGVLAINTTTRAFSAHLEGLKVQKK